MMPPRESATLVRFFANLALRPSDEIEPDLINWMDQWATIEFEVGRPITGVFQTRAGARRVCWYGDDPSASIRLAHAERYGAEPFWILSLRADPEGCRAVRVWECDHDAQVTTCRDWTFDRYGQPAQEQEYDASGALRCLRVYDCTPDGIIISRRERMASSSEEIVVYRIFERAVPELSAEPFPGGGILMADDARMVRLLSSISANSYQGRYRCVYYDGAMHHSAIATLSQIMPSRSARAHEALDLDLDDECLAPLVVKGYLQHPALLAWEPRIMGMAELVPDGAPIEDLVESAPLRPDEALGLALRIGEIALKAYASGRELGAIRPELVYVRQTLSGLKLSAILHRSPTLLASAGLTEAALIPPAFPRDFWAEDDVAALAQLLWYMITQEHPFYRRGCDRWEWSHTHVRKRERQPWRGPAALRSLLELALFSEANVRPSLPYFLSGLQRAASQGFFAEE